MDTGELILISLMNWLHLLATVTWIGGIFINVIVLMPVAAKVLEPPVMGGFMLAFFKRTRPVNYICMAVLIISGIIIMFANVSYTGEFTELWEISTMVKHIFVVIMIIIGVILFESIMPRIGRLSAQGPSPQLGKLRKTQMGLAMTVFVLSILVLLLTGISGAVSVLT